MLNVAVENFRILICIRQALSWNREPETGFPWILQEICC